MSILTRPDELITEFLKARLTDPRARLTSDSDTFTATASQTEFVLTPTTSSNLVRCITSVTVAGSAKEKWQEYSIDLANKKIVLTTGASAGETVVVAYKTSASGEDWIYPDMPRSDLGKTKFPRISIEVITKTGERNGPYSASVTNLVHFQVDCWTKDGYSKTYSGKNFTKQNLAEYLAHQVEDAFIDYVDDLYPKLYDYDEVAFNNMPFDEESQTYRHKQEFTLNGVDVGH